MQYRKVETGYFLRLVKGEEIISSLIQFATEEKISSAAFFGLGAVTHVELGSYNLENRKYEKAKFPEEMELGNITGNIGLLEGKPFVHAHLTVSGKDLRAFSGHLFSAIVAATLELFVFSSSAVLEREMDPEIGLNLLDL